MFASATHDHLPACEVPSKHQQLDDPSPHQLPQIRGPAAAGSGGGGTAGDGEDEEQRHDDLETWGVSVFMGVSTWLILINDG